MNECITSGQQLFTPAASLAALGVKLEQLNLFEPVHRLVHIQQKTVKHTPTQKLYDGFIALLAGAHGLIEINTRLRSDPARHSAFGRTACAEQSVVQQTLDQATAENIAQMEQAMDAIYRQHSQACHHNYQADWQILDVDLSGWLCGKKAAFAPKGYFSTTQRNRRGRQLGRVLATRYEEVVVDRLFPGNQQLGVSLQELMQAAQTTLELTQEQRGRCLVRVDAGGGSVPNLNWRLPRDYHILGKACSGQQARLLAKTVQQWITDPHLPERQCGWVTEEPTAFARPVRRLAVRCPKPDGQWGTGVLICSLSDQEILRLAGATLETTTAGEAVMLAVMSLYDQRGGGIETSFKGDKGGLGLTKRNKKRFEAQQLVMLLGSLAHNVIVWARAWLTQPMSMLGASQALTTKNPLRRYGILRMVRDVFHISGFLRFDAAGRITEIGLNQHAPLSRLVLLPLHHWLAPMHIVINLDKI
jgi:hypothetical protein